MENNFSFKTRIQVRYAETDAMGVVHHATYPIWFEQARVDFFRAVGAPYDEVEREGFASARAASAILSMSKQSLSTKAAASTNSFIRSP